MTDPVTPKYKQRDVVLLNGVPSTVMSWPADNGADKVAQFEQYSPQTKGYTRLTAYIGTAEIVEYNGGPIPTSLDEAAVATLAPADTIEEVVEEPVEEMAEEPVAETAPAETVVEEPAEQAATEEAAVVEPEAAEEAAAA